MSGNIDEVSKAIGSMQADISHIKKQTDLSVTYAQDHSQRIKDAEDDIEYMKPHVKDFRQIKQRGMGALFVLSLLWGAIGYGASAAYAFFKSGGIQ